MISSSALFRLAGSEPRAVAIALEAADTAPAYVVRWLRDDA
jgi:hypothetical protein